MFAKTFPGGVHPPIHKRRTESLAIVAMPPAKQVVLPLLQHTGAPCIPVVKLREKVACGQKIAASDKFISACIHASVSGVISKIDSFNHPLWGNYQAIFIDKEETGEQNPIFNPETKNPLELSNDKLVKIIQEAGIAGLGGAAFPSHVKLSPPPDKPIDTLIIDGAECEPYLTCDARLMRENSQEILKGIEIIIKILNPKKIFIGIEDNEKKAIKIMEKALQELKLMNIKIFCLNTKYPQGGEKQLIKTITSREVPSGKLPFDIGVVVHNVGTVFAIYEAIYAGKPLYERIITVSGEAIKNPANLKVRIGTLVCDIVEFCGGFSKNPVKIIMGGPMTGLAQFGLEFPILKGTSGILFLTEEELNLEEPGPCIRCGKCIEVCPIKIMPAQIALAAEKLRWDMAEEYSPLDCIECGACSYVCPTRRDLVHLIKLAKLASAKAANEKHG